MLQLVQVQPNASIPPLDPCSTNWHALPVPSVLQLVQAQTDVMQSSTPQEIRQLRRTTQTVPEKQTQCTMSR